jgi:3-phenylpropionate/cinnamic acid dioxygenase small subunit
MSGTLDRAAREEIGDVLVRYATGIDRRDWAAFRSCFADDCEADYGDIGQWHGADEITTWMRDTHEPCGHTLHSLTNVVVEADGSGGATARSYVDAIVLGPDNEHGARATGYYDDELTLTSNGWKIARRRFTVVLMQSVPQGRPLAIEEIAP